jgi:chemotaxis protein MotB
MAGKGGGSWKVAYADFVTAMMAFFMVMWIGSQDQKTRQAVANYFVDPSGSAKKPVAPGSVMNTLTHGAVPLSESTSVGKGRTSFTDPDQVSRPTKLMNDGLYGDSNSLGYWRDQANVARQQAARSTEVTDRKRPVNEVAANVLAQQLRDHFSRKVPNLSGVYQDLLFSALADVNWKQIAEDLLTNS